MASSFCPITHDFTGCFTYLQHVCLALLMAECIFDLLPALPQMRAYLLRQMHIISCYPRAFGRGARPISPFGDRLKCFQCSTTCLRVLSLASKGSRIRFHSVQYKCSKRHFPRRCHTESESIECTDKACGPKSLTRQPFPD